MYGHCVNRGKEKETRQIAYLVTLSMIVPAPTCPVTCRPLFPRFTHAEHAKNLKRDKKRVTLHFSSVIRRSICFFLFFFLEIVFPLRWLPSAECSACRWSFPLVWFPSIGGRARVTFGSFLQTKKGATTTATTTTTTRGVFCFVSRSWPPVVFVHKSMPYTASTIHFLV